MLLGSMQKQVKPLGSVEMARIKQEWKILKIRDVPSYLAFLERQAAIGRCSVKLDGQTMSPKVAIAYLREKFPWLN